MHSALEGAPAPERAVGGGERAGLQLGPDAAGGGGDDGESDGGALDGLTLAEMMRREEQAEDAAGGLQAAPTPADAGAGAKEEDRKGDGDGGECECLFHTLSLALAGRQPVKGWGGPDGWGNGPGQAALRLKSLVGSSCASVFDARCTAGRCSPLRRTAPRSPRLFSRCGCRVEGPGSSRVEVGGRTADTHSWREDG